MVLGSLDQHTCIASLPTGARPSASSGTVTKAGRQLRYCAERRRHVQELDAHNARIFAENLPDQPLTFDKQTP